MGYEYDVCEDALFRFGGDLRRASDWLAASDAGQHDGPHDVTEVPNYNLYTDSDGEESEVVAASQQRVSAVLGSMDTQPQLIT